MTAINVGLNLLNQIAGSQTLTIASIDGLQSALNSKENVSDLITKYYDSLAVDHKLSDLNHIYQPIGAYLTAASLIPYATTTTLNSSLTAYQPLGNYQPQGNYLTAASLIPYVTSSTLASSLASYQSSGSYQPLGNYLTTGSLLPYAKRQLH